MTQQELIALDLTEFYGKWFKNKSEAIRAMLPGTIGTNLSHVFNIIC